VKTEVSASRASPKIRWLGLGAGAFGVQATLIYGVASLGDAREWLPFLLPVAHLLLLPFLVRNLSFWGIRLILLGLLLNLTAMAANGGLMPVEGSAVEAVGRHQVEDLQSGSPIPGSKNVLVASEDVRLRELSDILVLPVPRPFTRAVSVGDLFVFTGVVIAYAEVMRRTGAWTIRRPR
jgi:hypothetical protein